VRVVIEPGILEEVVAHARKCLPQEGCGFLIGRGDRVHRFVAAHNELASPTAYDIAPQVLFGLVRDLRVSGDDLVAIYHSHPTTQAVPSSRDVAEAHYPDSAYVIVSLRDPAVPEIRAYRISDGLVDEVELHAIV
jgi:proteasome lid subunit RPN8/RPN11